MKRRPIFFSYFLKKKKIVYRSVEIYYSQRLSDYSVPYFTFVRKQTFMRFIPTVSLTHTQRTRSFATTPLTSRSRVRTTERRVSVTIATTGSPTTLSTSIWTNLENIVSSSISSKTAVLQTSTRAIRLESVWMSLCTLQHRFCQLTGLWISLSDLVGPRPLPTTTMTFLTSSS